MSYGGNHLYSQLDIFADADLNFSFLKYKFFKLLYFNFLYGFESLPVYFTNSSSIIPTIALKGRIGGVILGYHLRLSSFYSSAPVIEGMIAFRLFVTALNTNVILLNIAFANFDNFYYGNYGAYFLRVETTVHVHKNISLTNDITINQSGSVGLSSNFYGAKLRSGIKIVW
ncbi:hypothetical protein FACS1894190_14790 [Spirochaetia bacterium]|nr:hypothetical protein FACS1894190_14790 [Spirochaetia bacterium]